MTATALRIGQVAEATGLSEETLRYYEREGLLASVDRDALSGWGAVVHVITPQGITSKSLKGRMD